MYKIFEFAEEKGMARGMEQGIEQGMERGMERGRKQGLDEGIKKGMKKGLSNGLAKGREEGKAELLLKILNSRFEQIPPQYSKKIYKLSAEKIEDMGINIFKMKSLQDLEKYLQDK